MEYNTFLSLRDIMETGRCNGDTAALQHAGYIDGEGMPTDKGRAAMEPYRVKRAVFTAAGLGSRAVPLTYDIPKGMIDVRGEYMIERQIIQLLAAGVDEIWMVVGHMADGYRWLGGKYGVRFLTNPQYNSMNTIGSVNHSLQLFSDNLYLLTVDIYLEDNIFHSYEYRSWYAAPFVPGDTDEWCLALDENDFITDINIGGADSHIMRGPVYMAAPFAQRLAELIPEYVADPARHHMYWEHIYMEHMDEMPMYAFRMKDDSSLEFETLDELRQWDTRYINDSGNRHLQAIAKTLGIEEAGISDISPLSTGLFTRRFSFRAGEEYLHLYYDEDILPMLDGREAGGIISLEVPGSYICKAAPCIADDAAAMQALRSYHDSHPANGKPSSTLQQLGKYLPIMSAFSFIVDEEQAMLDALQDPVQTHGAFCPGNCLVTEGGFLLLENAFGCVGDRLADVGFYCATTDKDMAGLLAAYFGREPLAEELDRCRVYAAAAALALFTRYSQLSKNGVDCNGLQQIYLDRINKYS